MSNKNSNNSQSLIMIGIGLMLISAVLVYFALSQPKVSESELVQISVNSTPAIENVASQEYSIEGETVIDTTASSNQIVNISSSQKSTSVAITKQSSKPTAATTANSSDVEFPVNLNTCTIDDLVEIKGIGEARADAILQYREYLGGYTSVEQIKNIKGIGDRLYEKVAPYLTV